MFAPYIPRGPEMEPKTIAKVDSRLGRSSYGWGALIIGLPFVAVGGSLPDACALLASCKSASTTHRWSEQRIACRHPALCLGKPPCPDVPSMVASPQPGYGSTVELRILILVIFGAFSCEKV